MAEEFNILAINPPPASGSYDFELPVAGAFGAQTDTYISVLTIQPGGGAPAPTTHIVRQRDFGVEVAVPAFGLTANLMNGGTKIAEVSLVSPVSNGLATIHIFHTPTAVTDTELWQIKISHTGAGATDFFGVIAHSQSATLVPKVSIIIGTSVNPNPLTVNFGRATFNATRKKSAVIFNTGTALFTLGTVSLSNNATNFYALTVDPSGTAVNPNGKATAEIGYTPVLPPDPPPAPPHTATLNIPAAGLTTQVVNLTGEAMLREIVLLIDASNSMNWDNAGVKLASCPVASTRAANYDPNSRIRQVRASLQTFQSKLSAYGDKQSFLSIVQFPGGHLACGSSHLDALASPQGTWKTTIMGRTLYDQANAAFATNIQNSTDLAYYHSTPMTAGLQEGIAKFSATQFNYKVILLLSDGAHNVPDPATPAGALQAPLTLMPTLTSPTNRIRVCSIGFGNSVSVDHVLLQQLASQTGAAFGADPLSNQGYFEYNPTAPNNVPNLEKYYTEIFADLFELQGAADPTEQISRGTIKNHTALVTEFDQRVTFTLSWMTPVADLLGFELLAPNGERVAPGSNIAQYYAGPKHKMYAIDIDRLPSEYIGEWTLEVNYGVPMEAELARTHMTHSTMYGGPKVETYNFDVITRSGLELEVKFDKNHYQTGDRVVISAHLTENGRSLLGQEVIVQVQRPGEAMGNWHANNPVAAEKIEAAFAEAFGAVTTEAPSMAYKKQYYLTNVAGVTLPSRVNVHTGSGIPMLDDGQNGDLKAQDAIYTAALEGMATKPGTYYFMVVATGKTSNGNSFRRERLIHINIQTNVDVTLQFTQVSIEAVAGGEKGLSRFRVYVQPQDAMGNLLGPGFASLVAIRSSLGRPITTEVLDDLVGGYYRVFEYDPNSGTPVIEIAVGDKSLPPQIVGPEADASGFWKWLYSTFPRLARFLASCRNTNLLLLLILLLILVMIFRHLK